MASFEFQDQNAFMCRFFFSSGNEKAIAKICLTIEVTQNLVVFAVNFAIMQVTRLRARPKSPGARFSTLPKTFRALKAICENASCLLWKADLLTCFQAN